MADASSFARLVPGFDFLQGMIKGGSAALPGLSQWIAPSLDPAELDKRIRDLRTVQVWLEGNAKLIGATVQALEVQRMTLTTLRNLDLPLAQVRQAMTLDEPAAGPAAAAEAVAPPDEAPTPRPRRRARAGSAPAGAGGSAAAVDPTQWWGALTQQFAEIAATAMKQAPAAAAAGAAAAPASPRKKPAAKKTAARKARGRDAD